MRNTEHLVRQQVEEILASKWFIGASTIKELLSYLVDLHFEGKKVGSSTIAKKLYPKHDYETGMERARKAVCDLRKHLPRYYENIGSEFVYHITIQPRGYGLVLEYNEKLDLIEKGTLKISEFESLKDKLGQLNEKKRKLAGQIETWRPFNEKLDIFKVNQDIENTEILIRDALDIALRSFIGVLGKDPENVIAKKYLTDIHWNFYLEAERNNNWNEMIYLKRMIEFYDKDNRYKNDISNVGHLSIDTLQMGAEVKISRYTIASSMMTVEDPLCVSNFPISRMELPTGSYIVEITCRGCRDVKYPVFIVRNKHWTGSVKLYKDEEIGEGFCYIPSGPFIFGGDGTARNGKERQVIELPDYFISKYPVTMKEYMEFINDREWHSSQDARKKSPRISSVRHKKDDIYWIQNCNGIFSIPDVDKQGHKWDVNWPVFSISWNDAAEYCRWLSKKEDRYFSLPTEYEWEKAARGVDGRVFPWGNYEEHSFCNNIQSWERDAKPLRVGEKPFDKSVYGVMDMAGNVHDWCEDWFDENETYKVIRGGAWDCPLESSRCAYRFYNYPLSTVANFGFRVVHRGTPTDI